jgi:hypothetical protein
MHSIASSYNFKKENAFTYLSEEETWGISLVERS